MCNEYETYSKSKVELHAHSYARTVHNAAHDLPSLKGSHWYNLPMKGRLSYEEHWTALMCLLDGGQAWGWSRHTHTHTNIRDTYIYLTQRKVSSKLTFLIVTVCRRWSTAGNNLQPYLPFLGVWWRLASVTQPPRHPPISGSSLTRNTIQNQTVWIYFNAQGGYQICRACALALQFNWKSFPTPVLTLHYLV